MLTWGPKPTNMPQKMFLAGGNQAILKHILDCGGAEGLPVCRYTTSIPGIWGGVDIFRVEIFGRRCVPDQPTCFCCKTEVHYEKEGKMKEDRVRWNDSKMEANRLDSALVYWEDGEMKANSALLGRQQDESE